MQTNRTCPSCAAGDVMRVVRSRRVANSQKQDRECTACGHRDAVAVPREFVVPKRLNALISAAAATAKRRGPLKFKQGERPMGTLTAETVAAYFNATIETLKLWAEIAGFPTPINSGEGLLYREADVNVWLFWIMQRYRAELLGMTPDMLNATYPAPPYGELLYFDPIDAGETLAKTKAKAKA
jgi:Zn ribbon nucleic-acid-binding protein